MIKVMSRRNAEMKKIAGHFSGTAENSFNNEITEKKSFLANKSMMKALRMSLIHVLAFVFSWTPYTAMAMWSVSFSDRVIEGSMLCWLLIKKNDDTVKEGPAYCRSFLDGLYT